MIRHEHLDSQRRGPVLAEKPTRLERLKPTGKWSRLSQLALESIETDLPHNEDESGWIGVRFNQLIVEHPAPDVSIGKKRFRFWRDNGQHIIEERILATAQTTDQLTSTDREQQWNVKKEAQVEIIFPDNQRLSLNALLPPGYTLRPFMNDVHPMEARLFERTHKNPQLETVKTYAGATTERSGGQFRPRKKEVVYENLTRQGALLTVLHEIGHAWDAHNDINAIRFVGAVVDEMIELSRAVPPSDDEANIINLKPYLTKEGSVPVSLKLFKKRIKEAIDTERGPTAFAFRLLRELRSRGLDLEPGLDLSELIPHVDACLQSYQGALERYYATAADHEKMRNTTFV